MRNGCWFLLAMGWVAVCVAAEQPTTAPAWELRDGGRWLKVAEPTATPATDETLDHVEEMIKAKQGTPAKKIVVAWLKINKESPLRDRGLYLLGQANFINGDRLMAFYNFDELLDKYPGSRYFYPALDRQYDIADQYLRGYKNRFFGMPILSATSEATEMLYRIQQRSPGSPIAEKSLLRAADYYYADSDFDLAADAYAAYVRSYPRSPLIPRVRLRQAFSALAQFRGVRFDATPIIDARQQLLDLAAAYPTIADEENIPAIVRRIDSALAKKLWVTADFYQRTDKPAAAVFYYQYLVKTWPESVEAKQAAEKLARTPAEAQRAPELRKDKGATRPTTQPASPSKQESR
jgi:outer membrane assembly lipoprotein YfiO